VPIPNESRDREAGGRGTQYIAHRLRTAAVINVEVLPASAQVGPHDINARHVGGRITAIGGPGLIEHLVARRPVRHQFPGECAIRFRRRLKRPDAGDLRETLALERALAVWRDRNRIDWAGAKAWGGFVADHLALQRDRPAAPRRIDSRAGRQSETRHRRHGQSHDQCLAHIVILLDRFPAHVHAVASTWSNADIMNGSSLPITTINASADDAT